MKTWFLLTLTHQNRNPPFFLPTQTIIPQMQIIWLVVSQSYWTNFCKTILNLWFYWHKKVKNVNYYGWIWDSMIYCVISLIFLLAGFGILHIMTKYASIKHVIYSILIGRSVIVVGTPDLEGEVKNIVNALKIFLTSYHR